MRRCVGILEPRARAAHVPFSQVAALLPRRESCYPALYRRECKKAIDMMEGLAFETKRL